MIILEKKKKRVEITDDSMYEFMWVHYINKKNAKYSSKSMIIRKDLEDYLSWFNNLGYKVAE